MQELYILFKCTIWKRLKAVLFIWSIREFNPQNKEMIVYLILKLFCIKFL